MTKHSRYLFIFLLLLYPIAYRVMAADYYSYDGEVNHDIKRDRIIAIAEDPPVPGQLPLIQQSAGRRGQNIAGVVKPQQSSTLMASPKG